RAVLRTYDYGGETFTKYAVTGPDDLATAVVSHPSTTDQRVRMSGAYPLVDLRSQKCSGTDIFGSLVVCARPNGSVGLWDVSKPGAEPVSVGGGATGPVAIWGTRIAYRIAG